MIPRSRFRWSRIAVLLLLVHGCAGSYGQGLVSRAREAQVPAPLNPQQVSAAGKASLRDLIQSGNLPELRWPDFSTYRDDVARFYESYGYDLPWMKDLRPTPQAQAVILALQQADDKGLSADDYDGPRWAGRLTKLRPFIVKPSESDAVRLDLALTISLMRYISDLHTGKIDPRQFGIEANIAQRRYNLSEFLKERVVNASDFPTVLSQVEPPYPGYQRTIQALETYRRLAKEDTGQPFPEIRRTIAPGQTYAGTAQLVRFLQLVGDLPVDASSPTGHTVYDGALVDGMKRFQERHGLIPNGHIDEHTLEELNVPLNRRVQQIELTLERWRWLPPEYAESSIIVNIPEFQLRAYDSNFHVGATMKVVVGKAYDHKTPIFMSKLQQVIFRPYWEVPVSIATEEIIPEIRRDPAYLAKQDMEIVDMRGDAVAVNQVTADIVKQIEDGRLFVRQKPGPNNALGLIKFEFPNEYSVYMHDTPARLLFSQSKRDFSHGCIRLEKPAELAAWVLRNNPGWDAQRIRAAMNGEASFELKLAHPIPVLIVYGTAIVLQDGIVRFYDDLYGQDAELERALQQHYQYPH